MVKILSIDGGGIRGIIPASILVEIEKRTKQPIYKLFDLIAGTSTGGIIALGLTKPDHEGKVEYTAEDIVKLYEDYGAKIFYQPIWRKINNLGSVLDEKYSAKNLDRILNNYFKNSLLSHALTDVLVTGYEIERRSAFFFKSHKAKKDKSRDFLMKDAARATSAAPTYFEPEKIPTKDLEKYYALIDGGVFAGNPAMCAYVEALKMFPLEKNILVVSLGTGELEKPIYYDNAKNWGIAKWARPVLDVVLGGVSDTVDYQLKLLLPPKDHVKMYYRLQTRLEDINNAMDNTSDRNLRALRLFADNLIKDQSDTIDILCKQLLKDIKH
jgi:uncharacterized protein